MSRHYYYHYLYIDSYINTQRSANFQHPLVLMYRFPKHFLRPIKSIAIIEPPITREYNKHTSLNIDTSKRAR